MFWSLIKVLGERNKFDLNMTELELIFYYLKYSTLFTYFLPTKNVVP